VIAEILGYFDATAVITCGLLALVFVAAAVEDRKKRGRKR
jgi:hypothetical protein